MIAAQHKCQHPTCRPGEPHECAWNEALWPPPVQIHHLVAVAIPDPAQPAVDRVVLTPHRHLPVIEQFAQRVVWQLAQEPTQESRCEQAHGGLKQANEGAGGGGACGGQRRRQPLGAAPCLVRRPCATPLELHVTNLLPAMGVSLGLVDDDLGMQAGQPSQPQLRRDPSLHRFTVRNQASFRFSIGPASTMPIFAVC